MFTLEIMLLVLTIGATLIIAAMTIYLMTMTVSETLARRRQSDRLEKRWINEFARNKG